MFYITGTYFFSRWPEFTVGDIVWYVLKLWGQLVNLKWMKCFIFLLFYNALDLNNQKILCLPSIYEFERTGTNLNHPTVIWFWRLTTLLILFGCLRSPTVVRTQYHKVASINMIRLQAHFTIYTDCLLREIKTNLSKLVLAFFSFLKTFFRQTP